MGAAPMRVGSRWATRRWIVLALYGLLAGFYSLTVPLFEAPDEFAHMAYGRHLARGQGLPVVRPGSDAPWQQEGVQPPLYYAGLAVLARLIGWIPEDLEAFYRLHPLASDDPGREAGRNRVFHGEEAVFPASPTLRLLYLWRGLSVLLGAGVVGAAMAGARRMFRRPALAFEVGLFIATLPGFLFISAVVNNDAMVNATAALAVAPHLDRSGGALDRARGGPRRRPGPRRPEQTERPAPGAAGSGPGGDPRLAPTSVP